MTVHLPYSNMLDSKACVLFVEQEMKEKQTQNKKQASMNAMQVKLCLRSKLFTCFISWARCSLGLYFRSVKLESNESKAMLWKKEF